MLSAIRFASEPSAFITQSAHVADVCTPKAIIVPSGDQSGKRACSARVVSRVRCTPSREVSWISQCPSRFDANAIVGVGEWVVALAGTAARTTASNGITKRGMATARVRRGSCRSDAGRDTTAYRSQILGSDLVGSDLSGSDPGAQ